MPHTRNKLTGTCIVYQEIKRKRSICDVLQAKSDPICDPDDENHSVVGQSQTAQVLDAGVRSLPHSYEYDKRERIAEETQCQNYWHDITLGEVEDLPDEICWR